MTSRDNQSPNRWSPWISVAIAVVTFTVQWGVVTTKLDQMEKRLDEFLTEARALRKEYADINRRLAFIEGQQRQEKP